MISNNEPQAGNETCPLDIEIYFWPMNVTIGIAPPSVQYDQLLLENKLKNSSLSNFPCGKSRAEAVESSYVILLSHLWPDNAFVTVVAEDRS